jgi:hypothetical protein
VNTLNSLLKQSFILSRATPGTRTSLSIKQTMQVIDTINHGTLSKLSLMEKELEKEKNDQFRPKHNPV